MENELYLYYDEEGDFLEFSSGSMPKGHFKNLGDGIFERIDDATNQVSGIAIHGFKKRIQKDKNEQQWKTMNSFLEHNGNVKSKEAAGFKKSNPKDRNPFEMDTGKDKEDLTWLLG